MTTIAEAYAAAVFQLQIGRLDAAADLCRHILALAPNTAAACYLLGVIGYRQRRYPFAVEYLRRAILLNGTDATYHCNLGAVLHESGDLEGAAESYRHALQLAPNYVEVLNNRGNVFRDLGQGEEAVQSYRRALELKPDYVLALNNLGLVLRDQEKWDEAMACHRRAIEQKPQDADAYDHLGAAFQSQGKLNEAVDCFRHSLVVNPDFAKAHNNLGFTLQCQGKMAEALDCFTRALELKPDYALAHFNRAVVWLLLGDWQRGYPEYDWRRRLKDYAPRHRDRPMWNGSPLAGKTILLHADAGVGDTLQFIRYAPLLEQQGATVLVECQDALTKLLEAVPDINRVVGVSSRADLSECDVQAPLLSLPGLFQTTITTVPADVPYLVARAELVEKWQSRLSEFDGFKIGISWQGNIKYRHDRWRSIPLSYFEPLARVPGVRLIGLQKGEGVEQLAEVRDRFPVADLSGELDRETPFLDTAAVMKNLDLVIASDSALIHLAGALGVPTWVALPFVPDWRWLLERPDSPWYPTLRLFRQRSWGDWSSVFDEMTTALASFISSAAWSRSSLSSRPSPVPRT